MSSPVPSHAVVNGDSVRARRLAALAADLAACAQDAEAHDGILAARLRGVAHDLHEVAGERGVAHFKAIMDASRDAIVSADEHGRIVFFSGGAEAMFGWPPGEVLGRSLEVLMPERYRAAHRAALARYAATGDRRTLDRTVELEGMTRDGTEFPIEITLGTTSEGGRQAFTGVIRDISDRVAARLKLREAEERFTQAFGGAAMGLALVAPDGHVVRANPALAELSGHAERQLAGMRFAGLVHPDDRGLLVRAMRALSDGRTHRYVGEHRWLRQDGAVVHLRCHIGVVRENDGEARHFVVSLEDVTERRRMMEALTLSEGRYRALVENLPDTVITLFDGELRLLVAEGGGLEDFGRVASEIEGRLLAEVLDPGALEVIGPHFEAGLRGDGRSFDFEDPASGRTWWVQIAPMTDEGGRVIGGMAVWRDVSARAAAKRDLADRARELERSNAELEQFAYVASHDLSEPLRMVTSYLQLLQRRYEGRLDEDADEFIRFAVDGATRMRSLIDALLLYSRAGRGDTPVEPVDTAALVDRVAETLTAGREGPVARIHHGELPEIAGDPAQLGQLFQNLLGNALKFTSPGRAPEIEVSAAPAGPGWVFTVADNGIGFDEAHAERIFRMFQRLHGRDEYPGTGVGLAIARKVVERHGGRIWAEPRPEGGARFRFELPEAPA
jgi:PAS domain S-box-containing protein